MLLTSALVAMRFASNAPLASRPPAGTTPPYPSCCRARSFWAASKIAHPHEAVPDAPPAMKALGLLPNDIVRLLVSLRGRPVGATPGVPHLVA